MAAKSVLKKLPPPPLHTSPQKIKRVPSKGRRDDYKYITIYDPGCYTTSNNKFTYSPGKPTVFVNENNYHICTVGVRVAMYQSKGFAVRGGNPV
jgi:hypothetical protein